MKSARPKVLHQVAGKAMVDYVIEAARAAGATRVLVVAGHLIDQLRAHFDGAEVTLVEQAPRLGSGHALQQAIPWLSQAGGDVLVLNGDAPLIEADILRVLAAEHGDARMQASFLAASVDDPRRLGRVVRQEGRVRIVEWDDAS